MPLILCFEEIAVKDNDNSELALLVLSEAKGLAPVLSLTKEGICLSLLSSPT